MYEGAAQVHFISARTSEKSEMLYITWLNVLHFLTVEKSKIYCMGLKSTASGLTFHTKCTTFYSLPIHFTFCKCNKMYNKNNI